MLRSLPTAVGRTGTPCSVGRALEHLRETDPDSADDLEAYLGGEPLFASDADLHSRLLRHPALVAKGIRVGGQQIGHHRRGTCRCAQATA